MHYISSKTNDKIKAISGLLSSKKERKDKGLFVVEGVRVSLDVFNKGLVPQEVYITEKCLSVNENNFDNLLSSAKEIYTISYEVAQKLSDTKSPQGVFVVYPFRENNINIKPMGKYIMLCSLQDPGNIGTIIRSCMAFSIDGIIITDDCPDIYSPKILRSTMGAICSVDIFLCKDATDGTNMLKKHGIEIYAAVLHSDALKIQNINKDSGCCIMIGNEGNGLSESEISLSDKKVVIPMSDNAESLNAGIAASIFAWEFYRKI